MRKEKLSCGHCRHPGFKAEPWTVDQPWKMVFRCDRCGNTWSAGRTGREYVAAAMNAEVAQLISRQYAEFNERHGIVVRK